MTDVNGAVVLVTGAADGMGRLLSVVLARRGARLVLWDVDEAGLTTLVGEIEALGGSLELRTSAPGVRTYDAARGLVGVEHAMDAFVGREVAR